MHLFINSTKRCWRKFKWHANKNERNLEHVPFCSTVCDDKHKICTRSWNSSITFVSNPNKNLRTSVTALFGRPFIAQKPQSRQRPWFRFKGCSSRARGRPQPLQTRRRIRATESGHSDGKLSSFFREFNLFIFHPTMLFGRVRWQRRRPAIIPSSCAIQGLCAVEARDCLLAL